MAIELFGFTIGRKEKEKVLPSFAPPVTDDGSQVLPPAAGAYGTYLDLEGTTKNEIDLVYRYRNMSVFPETELAVDDIVNEAIITSAGVSPVALELGDLNLSDKIKDKIRKEFNEIIRLLDFKNQAYDIFRKWYVEGRLYYHIIIDPNEIRSGIQELRALDATKIKKIKQLDDGRRGHDGTITQTAITAHEYYVYSEGGLQQRAAPTIKIAPDSICYAHSGLLDEQRKMILSHLHKAIKPLNQLRMLEDATVIYRITRAPERRIFYIDVGNLPRMKAEQYLRDIMSRYKNKLVYNSETGEVTDDRRHQSMLEDYWLPRREGGKGTEITTLPGGENLGQLDDVEYFQKKLYKSLNVPISRLESDTGFSLGRESEITRDELKFSKFINRLQLRFSTLFNDLLEKQLILKGVIAKEDWVKINENISYQFAEDSHYREVKESEMMAGRLNLLRDAEDQIGKYLSKEWVRKNVLHQDEDDIESIDKQIKQEAKEEEGGEGEEGEGGEDGDYGNYGGQSAQMGNPAVN